MSVKWHISLSGEPAECGAELKACPRGEANHYPTKEAAETAHAWDMIAKHGEFATAKKAPVEAAAPTQAKTEKPLVRDRVLETVGNDFSGRTDDFPKVAGVKVEIEGTGEILTVKEKRTPAGLRSYVAVDRDGKEVTRYIPGPPYRIISGPDTDEFDGELETLKLGNRTYALSNQIDYEKAAWRNLIGEREGSDIYEVVNSRTKDSWVAVSGSNSDGTRGFTLYVDPDGNVLERGDTESRKAIKFKAALEEFGKDRLKGFLNLHAERSKLGEERRKHMVDQEEKFGRKY